MNQRGEAQIPAALRDLLSRQLAIGETALRVEQPDPARFKRITGWIAFVLGVPATVYALMMLADGAMGRQLWNDGQPITPALAVVYSLPCLAIALAFLSAPLHNDWVARNTVYAITDRRVLILRRRFLRNADCQSIAAQALQLKAKPDRNGAGGDIELVASEAIDDEDREDMFRLMALRDIRATEAALRQLIQSSSKSSL